jgi:hypothetical protein
MQSTPHIKKGIMDHHKIGILITDFFLEDFARQHGDSRGKGRLHRGELRQMIRGTETLKGIGCDYVFKICGDQTLQAEKIDGLVEMLGTLDMVYLVTKHRWGGLSKGDPEPQRIATTSFFAKTGALLNVLEKCPKDQFAHRMLESALWIVIQKNNFKAKPERPYWINELQFTDVVGNSRPPNCIVVLTPSRTGSSAVAGSLDRLGVDMGNFKRRPRTFNQSGQFEDRAFMSFSDQYLGTRGGTWSNPWVKGLGKPSKKELRQFKKFIQQRSATSKIWGWKNPRTILFINAFKHLLSKPLYIWVKRNRDATLKSMKHRHPTWERWACEKLHDYYVGLIEEFTKDQRVEIIRYEDLIESPKRHVTRLANMIGLPYKEKAVTFIDAGLRHF